MAQQQHQQHQQDDVSNPRPGEAGYTPMPHADDDELAEALRAAEAEAAKGQNQGEGQGDEPEPGAGEGEQSGDAAAATGQAEGAQPQGQQADTGQQQGEPGQQRPQGRQPRGQQGEPMIPHWRFKEATQAAYWRGKAEALAEAMKGRAPAQSDADAQPEPTPQEQIAALEGELDAAAEKYDNGEISFAQYEKVRRANERKIQDLQRPAPGTQGDVATREDLYLEERTEALAEDFPILTKLTAADVEPLVPLAYREAEREGVQITPGPRGDYLLRRFVAQVATRVYGGDQPAPAQQPSQQRQPPAAPQAQNGRKKVELAQRMPPDLNQVSGGRQPPSPTAPERIMSLDVDDIAALPDSQRRQLAGY